MSDDISTLFARNRAWAAQTEAREPGFFTRLAQQQSPRYMWIGCADSRVPANQVVNLMPGEVFVHRNVANLVVHTDLNCLSAIEFAIGVLKVRDVIVCGHYGCSGVRAALGRERIGLADNWLRHVQDVEAKHAGALGQLADRVARERRLCELNVAEQVRHVCETSVVREAWERGQPLSVHGWIYDLEDGLLRDLEVSRHGAA